MANKIVRLAERNSDVTDRALKRMRELYSECFDLAAGAERKNGTSSSSVAISAVASSIQDEDKDKDNGDGKRKAAGPSFHSLNLPLDICAKSNKQLRPMLERI